MRTIRGIDAAREVLLKRASTSPGSIDEREQTVRQIIADVADRGDAAVLEYTRKFDYAGLYTVTLNVSDAAKNWDTDTMMLTVRDIEKPKADPGPDRTEDQGTLIIFDASSSSDNVGIINFTWTFKYNNTDHKLYGELASFIFELPGYYQTTLEVIDARGNSDSSVVNITILDTTKPIAKAGDDRTIRVNNMTSFDAASSWDNIGIINYTWMFSYNGTQIELYGPKTMFRFGLEGNYSIILTVKDAAGNRNDDQLVVMVIRDPIHDEKDNISSDDDNKIDDENDIQNNSDQNGSENYENLTEDEDKSSDESNLTAMVIGIIVIIVIIVLIFIIFLMQKRKKEGTPKEDGKNEQVQEPKLEPGTPPIPQPEQTTIGPKKLEEEQESKNKIDRS